MVRLRGPISMYYELGHSIFNQNQSTCLNTYYELGYFELITDETCQPNVKNLLIVLKQINPFWHKLVHT